MEEIVNTLRSLPEHRLRKLAADVLDQASVQSVRNWEVHPIDAPSAGQGTVALLLCSGDAGTSSGVHPWSTVLKVLQPGALNRFGYSSQVFTPDREIEAYRSSLFASTDGSFRAAHHYGIEERDDGTVWLWMEDLSRYAGSQWQPDQYLAAARSLGRMNGADLQRELPEFEWLNRGTRGKGVKNPRLLNELRQCLLQEADSEYVRRELPGDLYERTIGLWDDAELMVRVVNSLPTTLAHNDCHIRNIFASTPESLKQEIVAIDLAGVGVEHIGLDAGDLFGSGFTWTDPEAEVLMNIGDAYFWEWLEGLRDTGWEVEEPAARLGFLAPIYQRAMTAAGLPAFVSSKMKGWEFPLSRFGGDEEDMPESFRRRVAFLLPLCEEAVDLARQVSR